MPVVLDLGSGSDTEPDLAEDVHNAVLDNAQRVARADRQWHTGETCINSRSIGIALIFEMDELLVASLGKLFKGIEQHAGFFTSFRRDVLHFICQKFDNTLGAEEPDAKLLEVGGVGGVERIYFLLVGQNLFL